MYNTFCVKKSSQSEQWFLSYAFLDIFCMMAVFSKQSGGGQAPISQRHICLGSDVMKRIWGRGGSVDKACD